MILLPSFWSAVSFCFFCSAAPPCPSTLSYTRYTFSLNRLSASPLWSFFLPFNFILFFASFLHEYNLLLAAFFDPAPFALNASRRMTNCKYSSSKKPFIRHKNRLINIIFCCRFFFLPGPFLAAAHHIIDRGNCCVYLINNNSFHSAPSSQNLIYLSLDYYFGAFFVLQDLFSMYKPIKPFNDCAAYEENDRE